MKFEYVSIRQVVEINERAGLHFFTPDTMRFFRSRVGGSAYYIGASDTSNYPFMPGYFIFTESCARGFRDTEQGRLRAYRINAMDGLSGRVIRLGEWSTGRARDRALKAFLASPEPVFTEWSLSECLD